ncbi:parathyroid hormone/parathyroid hormone-related peptide receptor-like [Cylas formicarius]|uniref:parathyroid hormone/parathyroid hormone-related peptide receptor-like n=1 Tax=Cylas formicarius TaxID=197179 RepID=UPI0029583DFA|nr:parathyroid hormone/parathyroid hormone-related peptide receptor-like [Cylas formicarius]XP_060520039.1 parathyroid hormone/parathyroid hormone-related peptide receptor-like [Cylas formicarius]XP_060520040.1 parathyroid hormone/parathyroid hormone-related peptide receptor-like [Cylas formicarius]
MSYFGVADVYYYQEIAFNRSRDECVKSYGPNITSNTPIYSVAHNSWMCPPFWDTITCWPPQLPNTIASLPCAEYAVGFIKTNNATRKCTENATWFVKAANATYTNYTACSNTSTITVFKTITDMHPDNLMSKDSADLVKIISETGYAVSLVSLIIAFTIMLLLRRLHCPRNILHMNLFASFILRAFMNILRYLIFFEGVGLQKDIKYLNGEAYFHTDSQSNNYECKLVTTLIQYFTLANYSWILMEGVYLNNLVLRALFTDSNKNLIYYFICGWGLPFLVVIPWVTAKLMLEDKMCWTTLDDWRVSFIILIPSFASVLISLVLFVIISTVLYKKLRAPVNEESRRYLKWAKSTLLLVPLFGVHYALFLVLYALDKKAIWLVCDRLFGSFQGFFVAILYCFINGEVKAELKPYVSSVMTFLATNKLTGCCFPGREKFLSSAVGRQSVCTTMSCSSLYNNGVSRRNSKTKFDVSKVKFSSFNADKSRESLTTNGAKHSTHKQRCNCYFPAQLTTNLDSCTCVETRSQKYRPACEEEVRMIHAA